MGKVFLCVTKGTNVTTVMRQEFIQVSHRARARLYRQGQRERSRLDACLVRDSTKNQYLVSSGSIKVSEDLQVNLQDHLGICNKLVSTF